MVNKHGKLITAAVTPLDLHDISRAAKTYGARRVFAVTPLEDQRQLIAKVLSHWIHGAGGEYNPKRKEALELVSVAPSLSAAAETIRAEHGAPPVVVATGAKKRLKHVGYHELKNKMTDGRPYLLMLGTAWGMAESMFEEADYVLAPIDGPSVYNHLSVRSAAAIILDRIMGNSNSRKDP